MPGKVRTGSTVGEFSLPRRRGELAGDRHGYSASKNQIRKGRVTKISAEPCSSPAGTRHHYMRGFISKAVKTSNISCHPC